MALSIGPDVVLGNGVSLIAQYDSQIQFIAPGTYSWTAPSFVRAVSVLCIGAGGGGGGEGLSAGGGGGGLVWVNFVPVTPGQTYTVVVGAGGAANYRANGSPGGNSYFNSSSYIVAYGGSGGVAKITAGNAVPTSAGGGFLNNSGCPGEGYYGGDALGLTASQSANIPSGYICGGGGGAAGYSGNGGKGSSIYGISPFTNGSGGGGAGGYFGSNSSIQDVGGGGGGTGIWGEGTSGTNSSGTQKALAGSNGVDATTAGNRTGPGGWPGGGGGGGTWGYIGAAGGKGGDGAVRIMWGPGREYPATNTEDQGYTPGQVAYTTAGTYTWTAPDGVRNISVVAVGGGGGGGTGGGGGGGGLGWRNSIIVEPGQTYTVVVGVGGTSFMQGYLTGGTGTDGGNSYFANTTTVMGVGGKGRYANVASNVAVVGGTFVGNGIPWITTLGYTGGGNGGNSGAMYSSGSEDEHGGGGGGAGGYTGAGGNGGWGNVYLGATTAATAGAGGGGGGGGVWISSGYIIDRTTGGGGGGVGILGQGANGTAGAMSNTGTSTGGGAGSSGTSGQPGNSSIFAIQASSGGNYGGGAGSSIYTSPYNTPNVVTAGGAVRIIWGTNRFFPNRNTDDQ